MLISEFQRRSTVWRAAGASFALLVLNCMPLPGSQRRTPRIEVRPESALVDEPLRVNLTGFAPGARVLITAGTPYGDYMLRSTATYIADGSGNVDLQTTAPDSGGSYEGVDPMGLFWSMRVDTAGRRADAGADAAAWSPPEPYTVTLAAFVNGTLVARGTIRRLFLAPRVTRRDLAETGLVARLYLPPDASGRLPVVISLTGSEGGLEELRAPMLASRGFATLSVAYFRAPSLPAELFEVPVETIERAVAWIRRQPELDGDRIAIRGASRGAELALLAATLIPDIRAVIADAPSDVVGQGIDRAGQSRAVSAWSWRGQPVPFLPQVATPEFTSQFQQRGPPYRLRPLHEASRRDTAAVRRAQIPVERINGPILLTSGEDDQYWPSSVHAEAIVARLRAAGFRYTVVHGVHRDAGHQILLPYLPTPPRTTGQFWLAGGTSAGYARADHQAWRDALTFLQTALSPATSR